MKIIKVNSCADPCPYLLGTEEPFPNYKCQEHKPYQDITYAVKNYLIHENCPLDDLLDDSHRLKEMHKVFDEIDPAGTTADVKKDVKE